MIWAAPLLVLAACGSGSSTDPASSSSQTNALTQGTGNSSASATVDVAFIGSGEGDLTITSVPSTGAASSDSNVEPLEPDDIVACTAPIEHIEQRTIELINQARSQPQNCGTEAFSATDPVTWNTKLLQAADQHSVDMTQHNFFDHTGSDGSSVATRVDDTDYEWRSVGENIAAGQLSAAEVVAGWLNSPGHCRNLMNPVFTEVTVTCVEDSGADYTRYWTNVLATPL